MHPKVLKEQLKKRRESQDIHNMREQCYHRRNLYSKPSYEDIIANFKLTDEQRERLKVMLKDNVSKKG